MSIIDTLSSQGPSIAYLLMFLVIFAETGLFFGFIFPGDTLLFGLGILAAQGKLSIILVLLITGVASILGNLIGFSFGKRVGLRLLSRLNARDQLVKTQNFYHTYGNRTILLARFVPIVRTFAPIVAGTANMPYPAFLTYTLVGGVSWVSIISLLGYFLGNRIPRVEHYIAPVFIAIILLSIIPGLYHLLKKRVHAKH